MMWAWMAEKAASSSGSCPPCLDPVQAAAALSLRLRWLMAWAEVALQQHTAICISQVLSSNGPMPGREILRDEHAGSIVRSL